MLRARLAPDARHLRAVHVAALCARRPTGASSARWRPPASRCGRTTPPFPRSASGASRSRAARRSSRPPPRPKGCASSTQTSMRAMFVLPADLGPVPVEINRLDNQCSSATTNPSGGGTNDARRKESGRTCNGWETLPLFRVQLMHTRREILAAFLGLPMALAACRTSEAPRLPEGEIVGASDRVGHLLRDGLKIDTGSRRMGAHGRRASSAAASRASRRRGGCCKAGFDDFVVLELERAAGGTSRSGSAHGVVPYPWGAHYLPAPMKENRAARLPARRDGRARRRGRAGATPSSRNSSYAATRRARLLSWALVRGSLPARGRERRRGRATPRSSTPRLMLGPRGATRAGAARSRSPSPTVPTTRRSRRSTASRWRSGCARAISTSPRLRWLVDYACRDDYGADRRAGERVGRPLLLRLAHERARRRRRSRSSRGPKATVVSSRISTTKWPAKVRLGLAVADIRPVEVEGRAGVETVAVGHDGQRAVGIRADAVIFAAPQFMSKYLIRPYRERAPAHVAEFEYGAWMVANLFLQDRPRQRLGFPLAWDNVLYDSPVARLRRRHAPARLRSRPHGLHLLLSADRRQPPRRPHAAT